MSEQCEYAVRVTLFPGKQVMHEFQHHLDTARSEYYRQADLHGRDAVEFLTCQVRRTPWVAGPLPPPVDRDGGVCDPQPCVKPTTVAGSIDTYEEAEA